MLSQNVEVGTAGKVEYISLVVRVVVYDWDPRLAEIDEYRDQEWRQASAGGNGGVKAFASKVSAKSLQDTIHLSGDIPPSLPGKCITS